LVLSWDDSLAGGMNSEDGYNVVLHEFAHQLDLESGAVNGMPGLHSAARRRDWTSTFSAAYADHCARVDAHTDTWLDPYAASSPAEFFAVITEAFYELPQVVQAQYPQVFTQLCDYYRVDPRNWQTN
jgi:Mlc titration factor MtfA (ptsG expression regulator)